jgi:hypothetical protein
MPQAIDQHNQLQLEQQLQHDAFTPSHNRHCRTTPAHVAGLVVSVIVSLAALCWLTC